MGWSLGNAAGNIADKAGVFGSAIATGFLKTSELIPGVDYSENDTIQSLYKNSDRMIQPMVNATAPLVDWTIETGIPGAGEIVAYATIVPTTAIRYGGEAVGLIDENSEFSKNNDRRIDNVIGYGKYAVTDPIDAVGQAGQGLTNAVTTTVGMVVDLGRGAINYADDAVIGIVNSGYETEEEKIKDDLWHVGDKNFFGVMTWAKDGTQFMPAISNQITDPKTGELVDNPNAKYQRLTRYSFQAGGEVAAMIATGGTLGAVWGATRGAKVVATTVRASEEVAEIAVKATAKVTEEAVEATARATAKVTEEAVEATVKTTAKTAEETVEATARATTTVEKTADATAKTTATVEKTADTTAKTTATTTQSADTTATAAAANAEEFVEETVKVAVNAQNSTAASTVANAADDVAVEITQTGGKMGVAETTAEAANEAVEMVVVRGVDGAKEGFVNGVKFMDPRASKGTMAAEAAGVTASMYMETKGDIDAANRASESIKQAVDSVVDDILEDANDLYGDDQASYTQPAKLSPQFSQSDPQSALNTEFTNRVNATQQSLDTVNGKPIFTIALNEADAVTFSKSLKV